MKRFKISAEAIVMITALAVAAFIGVLMIQAEQASDVLNEAARCLTTGEPLPEYKPGFFTHSYDREYKLIELIREMQIASTEMKEKP